MQRRRPSGECPEPPEGPGPCQHLNARSSDPQTIRQCSVLASSLWKRTKIFRVFGAEEKWAKCCSGDSAEKMPGQCVRICLQESEDQTRVCLNGLQCWPVNVCDPVKNCKQPRASSFRLESRKQPKMMPIFVGTDNRS